MGTQESSRDNSQDGRNASELPRPRLAETSTRKFMLKSLRSQREQRELETRSQPRLSLPQATPEFSKTPREESGSDTSDKPSTTERRESTPELPQPSLLLKTYELSLNKFWGLLDSQNFSWSYT